MLTIAFLTASGCKDDSSSSPPPPPPASASTDRFVDVTAATGIDFVHTSGATRRRFLPETTVGGAAWLDVDQDGDLDLYCVNGNEHPDTGGPGRATNRLYRNNGDSTFIDITEGSGLEDPRYGHGVVVGDYDNDGRPDVCVTNITGAALYHNEGNGRFRDVTVEAGLTAPGWTSAGTFFDYDRDGFLDLYLCRYVHYDASHDCQRNGVPSYCGPRDFPGQTDLLFRNNGDGTFTERGQQAGIAIPAPGLGVIATDYDDDGDDDLYVANDQARNFLFRNEGDGTFTEVGELSGVAYGDGARAQAGMGIDSADVDFDGRFDLVVTNFSDETNALYLNRGGGFFDESARAFGLGAPTLAPLGFGVVLFDHDLDGDPDLYVANGHVLDNVKALRPDSELDFAQVDLLLDNDAGRRFVDIAATSGAWFERALVGRAVAAADYDEDGDEDLFVIHTDGPGILLRNETSKDAHWIALRLRGTRSNRDALGAKVTFHLRTPAGESAARVFETRISRSYSAACDPRIRLGLGDGSMTVERVEIRWPGGGVQTARDLPIDQTVVIEETPSPSNP